MRPHDRPTTQTAELDAAAAEGGEPWRVVGRLLHQRERTHELQLGERNPLAIDELVDPREQTHRRLGLARHEER